ncbi:MULTISPECIES: DUF481 domain-containing protein [unclassified Sphingopyxis]|uniref:DUF481 domain-containing protein n=1 Tax=unclassified Sphingopyxis TaxID=2614943 RepID=UPI0024AC87A2|nr:MULTISPECIES: DUF481 domain-containing protein [unclassified Sphingopyxis]
MTALPRFAALGLLAVAGPSAHASSHPAQPNPALVDPVLANPVPESIVVLPPPPLSEAVRAMINAAIASGEDADVETVVKVAKLANPDHVAEIDALLARYRSQYPPVAPADPVGDLLAAAIVSGKDADVEAVGALAKTTNPDLATEIEARLVAYRAERQRLKDEAAAAAREKLASAKFYENWKGEGQIGATLSSGNTDSTGLSAGVALTRQGIDWNHKFRAQADYQRTNGQTSVERFVVEVEPQYKVSERAFAYSLGRWEQDRILGYDTRWNLSGGVGYKVVDREGLSLSVKGGPAWRQTDFTGGRHDSEITGLAGVDFGWQLSPALRLTQVASTIVGESKTATSSLTALNAKLTGALSARIAYSAEIDSNPPPGVENVDTLTRLTLVYGF